MGLLNQTPEEYRAELEYELKLLENAQKKLHTNYKSERIRTIQRRLAELPAPASAMSEAPANLCLIKGCVLLPHTEGKHSWQ